MKGESGVDLPAVSCLFQHRATLLCICMCETLRCILTGTRSQCYATVTALGAAIITTSYPHHHLILTDQVVALWRYRKKAVNGAPFVYECSELVPCASIEEQMVIRNYNHILYYFIPFCSILSYPILFYTLQSYPVHSCLVFFFVLSMHF